MKIAHICLSNYYMDNRAYQENELVEEHARQGHEVLVIASTQVINTERRREFVEPGRYRNAQGIEIIRLAYHQLIPHVLAKSLRVHRGVYELLEEFRPDSILFHGMCGWELVTVSMYKKANPDVKFYVDTHTDFINSARGIISKWILHFLYYRAIVHRSLPYIDKILCVSRLTEVFARDFYNIPQGKLEFYPLGGHPVSDKEYNYLRNKMRLALEVAPNDVVVIQTGKQSADKKIIETLKAFVRISDPSFKLFIVGSLLEDVREEAFKIIQADKRICYLGWRTPSELRAILCASDIYMQPGSQSATMQTSLCCRCVPVLASIEGHEIYVENDNGWLVSSEEDVYSVLSRISSEKDRLPSWKAASESFARDKLDYAALANRVLF